MHEVVVGALIDEGRVLLAHRRSTKLVNPDVWDLPGGLVEPGESELAALARELHEELGVHIETDSASHLCRVDVGSARLSAWLVPDWHGTPTNTAPEEHDDLQWFSLDDLPPPPHLLVRSELLGALRTRGTRPG